MKHLISRTLIILFVCCVSASAQNWTWMKGSNTTSQDGAYGTIGVEAPTNTPGARRCAASWTDASSNLWLFGGYVLFQSSEQRINDLWKHDVATGNWTWMKGSNTTGQEGTYGTMGVEAPMNTPGARANPVTWTDASGNLWLFGGYGPAISSYGYLNDLWKYNVSTGNWTWMKGPNAANHDGTYGTMGVEAPTNTPSGRGSAVSWIDESGDLWLFGGSGFATSTYGYMNDLWKYNVSTGNWTWMKGSNITGQSGTYGTMGIGAPANTPAARDGAVSWTDASGNFWLFGGYGETSSHGYMNDLWKYDVSTGNWAWMMGSNTLNQYGTYGTMGVEAPTNTPGSKWMAVSWTDASGNFWLFGGYGYASSSIGYMNDLWKYDVSVGNWIWIKGSNTAGEYGTYGTIGVEAPTNTPGARYCAVSWTGASGDLWLFGGSGTSSIGSMDDLWRCRLPAVRVNLIRNGGFEEGRDSWILCTIGGGSFGVVSPGFEGNYAGRVSIPRTLSLVLLQQSALALEPNTAYRLSFAAYSTTGHDMLAFVTTGRNTPSFMDDNTAARTPWIQKMYDAKLGKSWQTFSTDFKTRGFSSTTSDARLTFLFTPFARAGDMYYIDNVVLQKVDGSPQLAAGITAPLEEQNVAEENLVPEEFSLAQNYPNPFNPSTTIRYALPVASHVTLKVYNVLGQEVATLVDGMEDAGFKLAVFDASCLASGLYFYRVTAGSFVDTKKLLILK